MTSKDGFEPDLVSIITPAYNAERFIEETIRSVLAQSYQNWEMLIVDDGSNDRTAEIVESYASKDVRLRLFRLSRKDEASGPARARGFAIDRARGRYLAFLDSDDIWLPEKLKKQIKFMTDRDIAISFTAFRRFSGHGSRVGSLISVPEKATYRDILINNVIGSPTVLVDRTKVTIPPLTLGYQEDYMLWLSLLRDGLVAYGLNEDLSRYRVVSGSRSSKRARAVLWRWKSYRSQEKLPIAASAYYFFFYLLYACKKRLKF